MSDKKINWKGLVLGIILNILVIIAFMLIYSAYVIKPCETQSSADALYEVQSSSSVSQ